MIVTETYSEVQLQALLDHTALRLFKYIKKVVDTCSDEEKQNMVLIIISAIYGDVTGRNRCSINKIFKTAMIVIEIFFKVRLFL